MPFTLSLAVITPIYGHTFIALVYKAIFSQIISAIRTPIISLRDYIFIAFFFILHPMTLSAFYYCFAAIRFV